MIDGFALGPLYIRFYGIVLMLGTVAGGFLAAHEAKRRGHDPEMVWDLLVYLIIGGVIGARLWHIFTPPPSSIAQGFTTQYYLTHPLDAIAIWKGGLGIPGSVMGGLIALYFYTRKYPAISFVEWTDIAAPGLALGQAIGRWGNFFNQELYGAPTNLPWKIYIDPAHRLAGFQNEAYYHPLFLYESILNLLNMLLLLWIARQYSDKLKRGDVFNVYLIVYPIIRFSLDFLRLDASRIAGINANQTLSAVVAVLALLVLIWRHRPGTAEPEMMSMAVEPVLDAPASSSEPEAELLEPVVAKKTVRKSTTKSAPAKKFPTKTTAKKPAAKKNTK
ncbi:MAG: prolipoprotein diacylglyceryl transferase [Chloroflexi bacterium]|nr:prolipoprotein diacylglyceryl transferase [Chloroflexota bacterium]